ncbi:MAG: DUF1573 domain-containing protein [Chthoniobacteraceae bacterium]
MRSIALAVTLFTLLQSLPALAQLKWDAQQVEVKAEAGQEIVKVEFKFQNVGKTIIKLGEVSTSCGCTVAEPSKEVFLPGEKGTITANYTTGDHTGWQQKEINVETDDSTARNVILTLKVWVPPLLEMKPVAVGWKADEKPETKRLHAKIVCDQPMTITEVKCSDERVVVSLEKTGKPGEYDILVTPKATTDLIRAVITIQTDFPKDHPRQFSAYAWIR